MKFKLRSKRKQILLFFLFLIIGATGIYFYNARDKDYSSKESNASETTSIPTNHISLKVSPNKPVPDKYTALVYKLENLDDDSEYIKIYVNGKMVQEENIHFIDKKPYIIAHNLALSQLSHSMANGTVIWLDFTEKRIKKRYDLGLDNYTGLNIILQSREETIGNSKRQSIANIREKNGQTICGIEGIILDEPLTIFLKKNKENISYDQAVNYIANLIIDMQKAIDAGEREKECISITKIGVVEWDIKYLRSIINKLNQIKNDPNHPDKEFAYISFIQGEDYAHPWATAKQNTPIEEMRNLAKNNNLEYHMWVIGSEESLAFAKYTDKIIITDLWGRWGVSGNDLSVRHQFNKCYSPCIYTPAVNKCCPYLSTYEQEIQKLEKAIQDGTKTSYHIYEHKFTSGNHSVKIEIYNSNDQKIKELSKNITVNNSTLFCTPNCNGKQCGNDGCGGTCGSCPKEEYCNLNGKCTSCQPSCIDKACGYDGCGGSCGECQSTEHCSNGICIKNTPPIIGDFDNNNVLDGKDYGIILKDWADYYDKDKFNKRSDLNSNSKIDGPDYSLFIQAWTDFYDNR